MKETKMKRVPKLRFPEFTDDWEQRKLLNCVQKVIDFRGRTPKKLGMEWSDRGYLALSALNVKDGYIDFDQDVHYGDKTLYDKWMTGNELHQGQVLFTTEAPMGNVAQVPDNRRYILSQRTIAFEVNENIITENFLATILRTPAVFDTLTALSSGGTAKGVSQKSLATVDICIPQNLDEQIKLADYFSHLDHLITLHQRKLEKLKELRKGVMKKLFSQEVRFKADDGSEFPDWEEKKLGDDIQFINGRAYKQDELLNSGKYLVLRVGNLFTNDSYYYSDLELDNDKYIENGDLIYAWSATFGPRIYYGEKCIYHYHIWKLKFDENIISKIFLNYYLLYDVEKIKSQRTGGTMVHITKNAMEHRELQFPCLAEQQKIADCLSTLDDVIEKQKATLAAWEELKKGLLQQMFV